MQDCHDNHIRCSQYSRDANSWLPTRLIDVGVAGSQTWKLVVTAEALSTSFPKPSYLALSYKWGPKPDLLLLSSTIVEFRAGKPISELSKTFLDMVTVARHFSVRYLWIDALCIIQDSRQDWDSEAPTMRMVYANSLCTIAASAAVNERGGLFRQRDKSSVKRGFAAMPSGTIPETQYFDIVERDYWDWNIHTGPLHGRGWVFQERHLSCRVLSFTQRQILFECFECAKCETFPDGIPHYASDKDLNSLWNTNTQHKSLASAHTTSMSSPVFLLWRNLLQKYSSCALTKPEDRFPAFAGLAKLFQEVTGDEYLAGLWRSRFLDGLDWRVREPRPDTTTASFHAPSWSWASVDGPLKPWIPRAGAKHLVRLLDVKVTPRGSDPTGAIVSGSITLLGVVTKAQKTRILEDGSMVLHVASRTITVHMYLDKSDYRIDDGHFIDCLPLNMERSDEEDEDGHYTVHVCVLALLACPNGEHRRIGHFILEDAKSFPLFGLALEDETDSDGKTVSLKGDRSRVLMI